MELKYSPMFGDFVLLHKPNPRGTSVISFLESGSGIGKEEL